MFAYFGSGQTARGPRGRRGGTPPAFVPVTADGPFEVFSELPCQIRGFLCIAGAPFMYASLMVVLGTG